MHIVKLLLRTATSSVLAGCVVACSIPVAAQQSFTWEQLKAKFEAANPVLKADALNVDEMKAEEITAYLRPNPQYTLSEDGLQLARHNGVWQPLAGVQIQNNFS